MSSTSLALSGEGWSWEAERKEWRSWCESWRRSPWPPGEAALQRWRSRGCFQQGRGLWEGAGRGLTIQAFALATPETRSTQSALSFFLPPASSSHLLSQSLCSIPDKSTAIRGSQKARGSASGCREHPQVDAGLALRSTGSSMDTKRCFVNHFDDY